MGTSVVLVSQANLFEDSRLAQVVVESSPPTRHRNENVPDESYSSFVGDECSHRRDLELLSKIGTEILVLDHKARRSKGVKRAKLKKELVQLSLEHERVQNRVRQSLDDIDLTDKLVMIECHDAGPPPR